jgi:hypothetical protein
MQQVVALIAMFVLVALGASRMAKKNDSDLRDLAVIITLVIAVLR